MSEFWTQTLSAAAVVLLVLIASLYLGPAVAKAWDKVKRRDKN